MVAPLQQEGGRGPASGIHEGPDIGLLAQLALDLVQLLANAVRLGAELGEAAVQVSQSNLQRFLELPGQKAAHFRTLILVQLPDLQEFPVQLPSLIVLRGMGQGAQILAQRLRQIGQSLLQQLVDKGRRFLEQVLFQGANLGLKGPVVSRRFLNLSFQPDGNPSLPGWKPFVGIVAGLKDGAQAIVVPLGDGVVLVVVAAGALHREPHHGRGQDLDLVGDDVHALGDEPPLRGVGGIWGGPKKPGGRQPVDQLRGHLFLAVVGQLVSGDLLHQKLRVGLVPVEGPDHVVAVAPGVGPEAVMGSEAFRVGIAGQVQPVTPPALSVVAGVQQPLDHVLVGIGTLILQVGFDFGGGGRHSHQVQVGPPQQLQPRGRRRVAQPPGLQPGQQEGIHRCSYQVA